MTYQDPPEPWQQQPPAPYPASGPQPPGAYPMPAYPSVPTAKPPTRILGMPVWVFAIGLFVVVCCGGGAVFAVIGGVLEEAEPDPTFACTVLSVDDNEVLPSAEVEWTITNPGDGEVNELVNVTVLDGQGRQIGESYAGAFDVAGGATVVDTETVFLDAAPSGGETCAVAENR